MGTALPEPCAALLSTVPGQGHGRAPLTEICWTGEAGVQRRETTQGRRDARASFLSSVPPVTALDAQRPPPAQSAHTVHTRGYDRHAPISFKHHGEAHDPISQRREARLEIPVSQPQEPSSHGGPQRQEGNRQPERTGAAERSFGPENKSGAPGARPLQGPSAESPRKAPKASPGLPGTQRGALCREDCHPVQHHQHGAVSRLLPGTQTCTVRRLLGRTPPRHQPPGGRCTEAPTPSRYSLSSQDNPTLPPPQSVSLDMESIPLAVAQPRLSPAACGCSTAELASSSGLSQSVIPEAGSPLLSLLLAGGQQPSPSLPCWF